DAGAARVQPACGRGQPPATHSVALAASHLVGRASQRAGRCVGALGRGHARRRLTRVSGRLRRRPSFAVRAGRTHRPRDESAARRACGLAWSPSARDRGVGAASSRLRPLLAPAYVALTAMPCELPGTELGGRLWILFGLACLGLGLWLASRPRPVSAALPGFAAVPTALMLLNAQLDGIVALGLGAAIALWSRPFLAGLALGLTLVKPQLVLPLGLALIAARRWRVLAGWAVAGLVLTVSYLPLDPGWIAHFIAPAASTVQVIAREVDLAHMAV